MTSLKHKARALAAFGVQSDKSELPEKASSSNSMPRVQDPGMGAQPGALRRNMLAMGALQKLGGAKSQKADKSPGPDYSVYGSLDQAGKMRVSLLAASAFKKQNKRADQETGETSDEGGVVGTTGKKLQKAAVRAIAGLSLFRGGGVDPLSDQDSPVILEGGNDPEDPEGMSPERRAAVHKAILNGLLKELKRRCSAAVKLPLAADGTEIPIFSSMGGASREELATLERYLEEFNRQPDELRVRKLDLTARRGTESAFSDDIDDIDATPNPVFMGELTTVNRIKTGLGKKRLTLAHRSSSTNETPSKEKGLALNMCTEEAARSLCDVLTSFPSEMSACRVQNLILDGQPVAHMHTFFKNLAQHCADQNSRIENRTRWDLLGGMSQENSEDRWDCLQGLSLRRLRPIAQGTNVCHLCLHQIEDNVLLRYRTSSEMSSDILFHDSGLGCILVLRVRENGTAESLGIRPGYRVLSLNEKRNLNMADLSADNIKGPCRLNVMADLESEFLESLRLPLLEDLDLSSNDFSVGLGAADGDDNSSDMSSQCTQDLFRFAFLFAHFLKEQPLVSLKLNGCNLGFAERASFVRGTSLLTGAPASSSKDQPDQRQSHAQIFRSFVDSQFLKIMFGCTNRLSVAPPLKLQELKLKQNNLTQTHARQLLSALEGPLRQLKYLDVRQNMLGNEGALAIVGGLRQHEYGALPLAWLRLEQNHLTCDGAKRVLTELAQTWWVQVSIDVDNEMEHAQIAAFAQFRVRHRWLQGLKRPEVLVRLLAEELMASVAKKGEDEKQFEDAVRDQARAMHLLEIDEVWEAKDTIKAISFSTHNKRSEFINFKEAEYSAGLTMLHPWMCSRYANKQSLGHGCWHFLALAFHFCNADGVHEMVAELLDDFLEACRVAVRLAPFPVQLALQLCAIFNDRSIDDEHSDDFRRLKDYMGSFAHIAMGELRAFRITKLKEDKFFLTVVEKTSETQLEERRGVVTHPRFQQILYGHWGYASQQPLWMELRIPAFFFLARKTQHIKRRNLSASFLDLDSLSQNILREKTEIRPREAMPVGNGPFAYVNLCPRNIFMLRMCSTLSFIIMIYGMIHGKIGFGMDSMDIPVKTVVKCPEDGPGNFYDPSSCTLCPADILYISFCASILCSEGLELYYSVLKNMRAGHDIGTSLEEGVSRYLSSGWNFFDLVLTFFACDTSIRLLFRISQQYVKRHMGLLLVCSILRLQNIVALAPRVGPFVKMVGAMLKDIAMWTFIYIFVLCGFAAGFNVTLTDAVMRLEGRSSCSEDEACDTGLLAEFVNFGTCCLHLFTISTGDNIGDALNLAVAVLKYGEGPYMLIGMLAFIIVSTILLLNLLIAIMSDTYRNIIDQSEAAYHLSLLGAHNESMHMAKTQQFQKLPPPLTLPAVLLFLPWVPITLSPAGCVSNRVIDTFLRLHVKICCLLLYCLIVGPFMLFMACYLPLAVMANLKTSMLDKKRIVLLPFFLAFGYVVALMITCCNVFQIVVIRSEPFWKGKRPKKEQAELKEEDEGDTMKLNSSLTSSRQGNSTEIGSLSLWAFSPGSSANEAETPWSSSRPMASPSGAKWHHPDSPEEEPPALHSKESAAPFGRNTTTAFGHAISESKGNVKSSFGRAMRALKMTTPTNQQNGIQRSDTDQNLPSPSLIEESPKTLPPLPEDTEQDVDDMAGKDVQSDAQNFEQWFHEEAIKSKETKHSYNDGDVEIVLCVLKAIMDAPADCADLARDEKLRHILHNEKEDMPDIRKEWIDSWEDEYFFDRYRMRLSKAHRCGGFEHRRNEISFGCSLFGLAAPALSGDKGLEVSRSAASHDVQLGLSDLQKDSSEQADAICDLVKEQTMQIKSLFEKGGSPQGSVSRLSANSPAVASKSPRANGEEGEAPELDIMSDTSFLNRRLGLILKSVQNLGKPPTDVVSSLRSNGFSEEVAEAVPDALQTRVHEFSEELAEVRKEVSDLSLGVRDTFKHMMQEMSGFIQQVHEGSSPINPDLAAEKSSLHQELRSMRQDMAHMRHRLKSKLQSPSPETMNGGRVQGDMYFFGDLHVEDISSLGPTSTLQTQ